jgi:uncharacterized integral membrane protein
MAYASENGRPASDPSEPEPPLPLAPEPEPVRSRGPESAGTLEPFTPPAAGESYPKLEPDQKHQPAPSVPRTRVSTVWFGVVAGALGLIVLIIFVAQNTGSVQINFLWMSGNFSIAVALLIAGVAGALVAIAVAAARIIQLRRLVRRRPRR